MIAIRRGGGRCGSITRDPFTEHVRQPVNICSARRAFSLVYAGHAQIVSSDEANNFMTHDFESWRDLSANAPDHEVVTTISFKIRIPRVIVLLVFDRLPKKEVKFTR